MSMIGKNIKTLRKKFGYTQLKLAEKIGVKKSLIGAIEEGRSEPRVSIAVKISKLFDCSLDQILNSDFTFENVIPVDSEGKNLRVLTIPVSDDQTERITLVPISARAGYAMSLSNPNYINELPSFHLPLKQVSTSSTYRMFEISGDSMMPIEPGSYLLTEYIQNWRELKNGNAYVFISKFDGIFFKRILVKSTSILMKSDNPEFNDFEIPTNEILEIWTPKGYISFDPRRFFASTD